MADSETPSQPQPNPILVQVITDLDRARRRLEGDWNDFTYKFTLTESEERHFRAKCTEWEMDFDEEWKMFNDCMDFSEAQTPFQRKAENRWHSNRIDPQYLYENFAGWLKGRYYHRKFSTS